MSFTGGKKLASRLKEISEKIDSATRVNVGFFPDKNYSDGTSVAMVAAIQEFGAPGASIPPRPFFRTMIKQNKASWGPALAGLLKQNEFNAADALGKMGEVMIGELQDSIVATNDPPLSPITLMLRKMRSEGVEITGKTVGEAAARVAAGEQATGVNTKVLIDTGQMLNSITREVE